jgi:hypothetical protein
MKDKLCKFLFMMLLKSLKSYIIKLLFKHNFFKKKQYTILIFFDLKTTNIFFYKKNIFLKIIFGDL